MLEKIVIKTVATHIPYVKSGPTFFRCFLITTVTNTFWNELYILLELPEIVNFGFKMLRYTV